MPPTPSHPPRPRRPISRPSEPPRLSVIRQIDGRHHRHAPSPQPPYIPSPPTAAPAAPSPPYRSPRRHPWRCRRIPPLPTPPPTTLAPPPSARYRPTPTPPIQSRHHRRLQNLITGVTKGYHYKMRFVYAHFPINASITNENKSIEIRNFLGEKKVQKVDMLGGVTVLRSEKVKDELVLDGNDIKLVS